MELTMSGPLETDDAGSSGVRMTGRLTWLAVALFVIGFGRVSATAPQAGGADDDGGLIRLLQSTAVAWNGGDLDAFVAPYADDATYMTATGPIGRDAIKARYASKYFTGGKPDQQVRFDQTTVRPLGPDHALMTGRFTLSGGGQPDRSGWFSLVWKRTPSGWRILHDHSS
jgi:uncharacterized protein (TIGR02246 family)